MKLEELANKAFASLTESERNILSSILSLPQRGGDLSCEEMAGVCHVSRTTLLRFCRKLGLNSFAELHYTLSLEGKEKRGAGILDIGDACMAYHRMVDEIKGYQYRDVCRLIDQADTIYVYGTGNAQKAEAEEFKRIFLSAGKCIIDLFDLGEVEFASLEFGKQDLFVIISLSGETPEGVQVLKTIGHTKIPTLSLTRWDNNAIARLCSHNLYVGTRTLQGYHNLSYEMTAAFYLLLDILFIHYLEYMRTVSKGGGR